MKRLPILIFFLSIFSTQAQINELGVFLGGSNYIGDIGPTDYIKPNDLALGIVYKWNRSPRHSYRLSLKHAKISSDDLDSESEGRQLRGYEFDNSITEVTAAFEFNFFDFNLHDLEPQFTPYVYTGISYFFYKESYFASGVHEKDGSESSLAIPMAVGFKTNIAPKFVIGVEVGFRYTFTDNLDGSNPEAKDLAAFRFGNINSKDWYTFTGVTLTYTFTEKPCFCSD